MTQSQWALEGEAIREPLHYTACGLDDVYLLNGYDRHATAHGAGISIHAVDGLHKAIALFLCLHKKVLSAKELRFLRKLMDLTQSELGRLVGLSSQQVARWEKGQCDAQPGAERILRMLVSQHLGSKIDIRSLLNDLDEMDSRVGGRQVFERDDDEWRPAAA